MFRIASATLLLFFCCGQVIQAKTLSLAPSLWEGVSEEYGEYNLLEIKNNGQHSLHRIFLRGGLRIKQLPFSNKDIKCERDLCHISIDEPNEGIVFQLRLSKKFSDGPFLVLETAIGDNEKVIISKSYELKEKKGQSTVRDFLDRFKTRLQNLQYEDNQELSGLWLGTLNMDGNIDMLVLNKSDQSKFQLIRFVNGTGYTNETTFEYKDIQNLGDALLIETSHKTFANKLLLHRRGKTRIDGHFYSYHNGQALQTGAFSLTKLKLNP